MALRCRCFLDFVHMRVSLCPLGIWHNSNGLRPGVPAEALLRQEGMDEAICQHISHLFTRDPLAPRTAAWDGMAWGWRFQAGDTSLSQAALSGSVVGGSSNSQELVPFL